MSFFDEQMENAKAAFDLAKQGAQNVAAMSKLKIKEKRLQNKLEELYSKLGRQYYSSVKQGSEIKSDELIDSIDELQAQLKELREEIENPDL